jgi:hypothetical protein
MLPKLKSGTYILVYRSSLGTFWSTYVLYHFHSILYHPHTFPTLIWTHQLTCYCSESSSIIIHLTISLFSATSVDPGPSHTSPKWLATPPSHPLLEPLFPHVYYHSIWNEEDYLKSGRSRSQYLSIRREIQQIVIIIVPIYKTGDIADCNNYRGISYHFCQLHTTFYPTSCSQG